MTRKAAIKVLDAKQGLVTGLGIPFGGPVPGGAGKGRDLEGEYFSPDTNFHLDWFPDDNRPALYDHGVNPAIKADVIGRQISKEIDDDVGIFTTVQLNMANRYGAAILGLAEAGKLAFSSGSFKHLRKVSRTGHIEEWPWVEQTLTVAPANPYTLIPTEAVKHLSALGLDPSDELTDALKALPAGELDNPPDRTTLFALKALELPDDVSVEDLRDRLRAAIADKFPALAPADGPGFWISAVYDGNVVIERSGPDQDFAQIDFELDADAAVSLTSEPLTVERRTSFEPAAAPAAKRYSEQAAELLAGVADFVERSRSLADLRAKDGRLLSDSAYKALQDVSGELLELLQATEPAAKGLEREFLRFEQLRGTLRV